MHSFNIRSCNRSCRCYEAIHIAKLRSMSATYIYMCVCVRVYYTYKYIHTQLRTHDLYIYIYTCILCMYVCMYVCACTHRHTHTHTLSLSHCRLQQVAASGFVPLLPQPGGLLQVFPPVFPGFTCMFLPRCLLLFMTNCSSLPTFIAWLVAKPRW